MMFRREALFVRLSVCVCAVSSSCRVAWASSGLRGNVEDAQSQNDVPDIIPSHWGGNSFSEGPLAFNPWAGGVPYPLLDDLQPVAPYDRLDSMPAGRLSSAGPLLPGAKQNSDVKMTARPDFTPVYQHPKKFPWEGADDAPQAHLPGMLPIGNRYVVAKPDRLRQISRWDPRPEVNYPLVAPSNRLQSGPNPIAQEDYISDRYGKYVEQVYRAVVVNKQNLVYEHIFKNADVNKDGSISPEEFANELVNRQGKSQDEKSKLWVRFHTDNPDSQDMTHDEFTSLTGTGFDLGYVNRSDINIVLTPPSAANRGFWGSGVACPSGTFAIGSRLKVMPISKTKDNTALNSVGLKCDDQSEVQSAEGPDGTWTDWAMCPEGQRISGFRARIQDYGEARDNSGMSNIEFSCRSSDLTASSVLRFEGEQQTQADPWATCNPTSCPSAITCTSKPETCCAADDWGCCGTGENKFSTRLYCPVKSKFNIMCHNGHCYDSEAACDDHGGVKFVAEACVATTTPAPSQAIVYAKGPVADAGGWMPMTDCGTAGLVCGVQVRLEIAPAPDTMGITDSRFFCCASDVDCSTVCGSGGVSPECNACKAKSGTVVVKRR